MINAGAIVVACSLCCRLKPACLEAGSPDRLVKLLVANDVGSEANPDGRSNDFDAVNSWQVSQTSFDLPGLLVRFDSIDDPQHSASLAGRGLDVHIFKRRHWWTLLSTKSGWT